VRRWSVAASRDLGRNRSRSRWTVRRRPWRSQSLVKWKEPHTFRRIIASPKKNKRKSALSRAGVDPGLLHLAIGGFDGKPLAIRFANKSAYCRAEIPNRHRRTCVGHAGSTKNPARMPHSLLWGGMANGAVGAQPPQICVPLRSPAACCGELHYTYRNHRGGNRREVEELPAGKFLHRFLQHVLPDGFFRIRHYGRLANCVKQQRLTQCRRLLGARTLMVADEPPQTAAQWLMLLLGIDITQCPQCGGRLQSDSFPALDTFPSPTCQQPACRGFPPWDTS
jgi:hypothetical protein